MVAEVLGHSYGRRFLLVVFLGSSKMEAEHLATAEGENCAYGPTLIGTLEYLFLEVSPQKFAKSPQIICPIYCQSNNWWRFQKTLWPSQSI